MISISKTWSATLKMLHQSLRQVVLVHLVFTALGFILFSPMIAGVGRLLIMISGQPALDDQDILYFFLTPSGMFAAVLMLALFVTILAFEQASLMRLAVDASSGFVRRVHRAGKKVFVWTINDPVTMSRMMSLGVDGIITDEPELARRVVQQRKEMNIAERLLIHTTLIFGQPFTPRQYRDGSP